MISAANTHGIKVVTDIIDNKVIKRPTTFVSTAKKIRKQYQHLHLDRAYDSTPIKQEIIKRGCVSHIPYKRKRTK
ncbi:MAG TPA: hypothetical protein VN703_00205 [Candidatus Sulfopaludibacter sp.]|nr:hypothetical protein [Candidatus Sulfopaludibacter sp.]